MGWYTSHINLFYDEEQKQLYAQYYLRTIALWTLYIPAYLDAEPGFVGGAMKGIMNDQLMQILIQSGITQVKRQKSSIFDPFPPIQNLK